MFHTVCTEVHLRFLRSDIRSFDLSGTNIKYTMSADPKKTPGEAKDEELLGKNYLYDYFDLEIERKDVDVLENGGWLTDIVISAYFKYVVALRRGKGAHKYIGRNMRSSQRTFISPYTCTILLFITGTSSILYLKTIERQFSSLTRA